MSEKSQLPALIEGSAREMAAALGPAASAESIYNLLPEALRTFVDKRIRPSDEMDQPDLPGMSDSESLGISYLKLISANTRSKIWKGEELKDGSVLGKSPVYRPPGVKDKKTDTGFPFVLLYAWTERSYGVWNQDEERMDTYCQSADGVVPSLRNHWGARDCKSCPHNPENRQKYDEETEEGKKQRCKRIYNLFGVGGDWRDFYVLQVKGRAIMSLYYKGIIPHIKNLAKDRLPYFALTFMLGTVKSGNYYEFELLDAIPTVPLPDYQGTPLFSFPKNDTNGPPVTMQFLRHLQTIGTRSVQERQEAAKESVRDFLESTTPVNVTVSEVVEAAEVSDDDDAEAGLD